MLLGNDENRGYGGTQKTCYDTALRLGAEIVVMILCCAAAVQYRLDRAGLVQSPLFRRKAASR